MDTRRTAPLLLCLLAALVASGCGRGSDSEQDVSPRPAIGTRGSEPSAARELGFPLVATKNTTRIGGADAVANAAATARAVFPGGPDGRPAAVTLVDRRDWRSALAASLLMSPPLRAPVLLADGATGLPKGSADALAALDPKGSKVTGGAQVIRVGTVPRPTGVKTTDIRGRDPFALGRALDAFHASARGRTSDRVLVVPFEEPAYAMPAAAWAAKSGDPVLFTRRGSLPADTKAAIKTHSKPKIYVLGPTKVIGTKVTQELRKLGTVTRIGGPDPVRNAIAFARFADGAFGWGVVDPGHGLVVLRAEADPATAAGVSPLSSSGTYGPLLLTDAAGKLPSALDDYLATIRPGFTNDPVRAVYNRGWLIGDLGAIGADQQARIDALLEIKPVSSDQAQTGTTAP